MVGFNTSSQKKKEIPQLPSYASLNSDFDSTEEKNQFVDEF